MQGMPVIGVESQGKVSFPPVPGSAHPAPPPVSPPPKSPRTRRWVETSLQPPLPASGPGYVASYSTALRSGYQQPSYGYEERRYGYEGPRYDYDQTRRALHESRSDGSYQIPLQPLPWFERLLMAFGVLELILLVIGFWQAGTAGG
jgi:hypothetical protein